MSDIPSGDLALRVAETLRAREGTGDALGITIDAVGEGHASVRMTVRPDMLNGHGTVHGGMIFTLADTAFAYACNSRNVTTVAAQASILFLAPARAGEVLVAEAVERQVAGRSGSYMVAVSTAEGRAIADFQGLSRSVGGPIIPSQED
jgi:acyl-CoA thioesterase